MDKDIKEIAEQVIKDAKIGSLGKTTREYRLAQYILNPWIPVSERLPERDGHYLCYFGFNDKFFEVRVVPFSADQKVWHSGYDFPISWVPLPPIPDEE